MTGRRGILALALAAALAPAAAPAQVAPVDLGAGHAAAGRQDWPAAWAAYRAAYDPAADDPAVVATLAAAAERMGQPERFLALADSVIRDHPETPYARAHRGAARLRAGDDVADVVEAWRAWLETEPGRAVHAPLFARILGGHGAFTPAESLLDGTITRSGPSPSLSLALGDIRSLRGDRAGALDAYAGALAGPTAIDAASRMEEIVDAMVEEGDWIPAIHAARSLPPSSRAVRLRETARGALEAGDRPAARSAAERLIAMGSPWSRSSDQGLLEEATGTAPPAPSRLDRGPAGLLAEVATARASGDPAVIEAALERAEAGGVGAALLAVPAGDLWLARGNADSALVSYGRAVDGPTAGAIEALGRFRLVRWLLERPDGPLTMNVVGDAILRAPVEPEAAARAVESIAGPEDAPLDVGGAILSGLAGEWRGRGGDPAGASRGLEAAARRTEPADAGSLLLAAGRWALEAGDDERARALWREVAVDHADSPYAMEARRLLEAPEAGR